MDFTAAIQEFINQKHFPCVGAVRSLREKQYLIGSYENFGTGKSWRALRRDLENFLAEVKKTKSPYLSYWAIFPNDTDLSEALFEAALWQELSCLTSQENRLSDWRGDEIQNPEDPRFQLRLNGEALFVVGLHPSSSRKGRRFLSCALVFNAFSQFESLMSQGKYQPMVQANRKLDTLFQGTANPMALQHGETWETIQFSGSAKSSSWKCPFHFLAEKEKP